MRWSDLTYNDYYIPFDENQRAVRGFWLTTLGIDLERLPNNFFESFKHFERNKKNGDKFEHRKVFLHDIVGTSYLDYSADNKIIYSYMKIKRAYYYIQEGIVTRGKYFHMLKKPYYEQSCPIILSQNDDGNYYVDGNGNHRVVLYKIMLLSEIAKQYSWVYEDDYDLNFKGFNDVYKKYWLNAKIILL